MALLKIRDEHGTVHDVMALKGEKGDPGEVSMAYAGATFANALKGEANGGVVKLSDVSPVPHTLDCNLQYNGFVQGKNLVDYVAVFTENGFSVTDGVVSGTVGALSAVTIQIPDGYSGIPVTLSMDVSTENGNVTVMKVNEEGNIISGEMWDTGTGSEYVRCSYTLDANVYDVVTDTYLPRPDGYGWKFQAYDDADHILKIKNVQLEVGTTATEYEEYGKGAFNYSGVTVKRYGKNLIPYPYNMTTYTKNGITFTDNGDGTITINGHATATTPFYLCGQSVSTRVFLKAGTYTLSGMPTASNLMMYFYESQNSSSHYMYQYTRNDTPKTITVEQDSWVMSYISPSTTFAYDNVVVKPLLEVGNSGTEYEQYKEPNTYTTNADGTVDGVQSLFPTTTLIPDVSDIEITAKYSRDINKVITKLQQAIISLGGKV